MTPFPSPDAEPVFGAPKSVDICSTDCAVEFVRAGMTAPPEPEPEPEVAAEPAEE